MPRQKFTTESLSQADRSSVFNAEYYLSGLGPGPYERNDHWLSFFGGIAAEVVRSLHPQTVFDAGCAMGMLVESFWDLGIPSWGVDVSAYAIDHLRPDMRRYCRLGSVTDPIESRYDLITSVEVLEHVLPEEAERAIAVMAAATDTILFSSSPTDFVEETHVNVQPVASWIEQFGAVGFVPDLVFDASFLSPHAILFRRAEKKLPPDVASVFSQFIRLRTAMVEREQRIGRLNAELAQARSELEPTSDLLPELPLRREDLARQLAELGVANEALRGQLLAQEGSVQLARANAKQEALTKLTDEAASYHDQLTATGHDITTLSEANQEQRERIRELDRQVSAGLARANAERDTLTQRLAESASYIRRLEGQILEEEVNASRIKEELQSVYSSPGWHLISSYRKWLNHRRRGGGFVARRLEHLLTVSVDAIGLGGKNSAIAVQSIPAVPIPALAPTVQAAPAALTYDAWIARSEPNFQELELQRTIAAQFCLQPLISIVVPVFRVPMEVLQAMVDSVRVQTYRAWELCVVHADREDTEAREYLKGLASQDERIRIDFASENLGISGNSNAALKMARGEYLALLDHDDTLAPFALYEVVKVINERPEVDFIYSDKDCLSEDGGVRIRPLFKPRWSPDIMLSVNYLTHLCVMRVQLMRDVGGWRPETDGAQDWDIFLRLIRRSQCVEFIPKVLYHWRIISTSVASTGLQAKPYAAQAQLRTLEHHLEELGIKGKPVFDSLDILKVEWGGLKDLGASIIVVSEAPTGSVQQRARELATRTDHFAFEVIAIAPGLQAGEEGIIRWIGCPEQMSLAARLNEAASHSKHPCLVFVDDAVDVGDGAWVSELVGPLQQEAVGLVGCKLVEPTTSRFRHAGIVFNRDGKPDYIFSGEPEHINETFGGGYWYRNWSAISGACFAIRRDVWERLRGFLETPEYPRLDIDLCLRAQVDGGFRIVYNPFARFQQVHDSILERWLSPSGADAGAAFIRACFPSGDPYFHPELECRLGRVIFARPERTAQTSADYAADARALTGLFDFSAADIDRSTAVGATPGREEIKSITWFLPEFSHGFYGGIHTILRFAEYFQRLHGVWSNFVFLGGTPESLMRSRIAEVYPKLGQACGVSRLVSFDQLNNLPETDGAISTLWTTAFAALRFSRTRRKFYFIQDYESLFYPAGSINALVEATYRFGFHGICNTRGLLDTYASLGGVGEYFDPCIDQSVFYPSADPKPGKPLMVFCYARPGHPRNCFELLAAAVTKVKHELGENVRIVAAGADWDPAIYGLEGVVQNLGLIGYSATGALYRACDAGVVMMMTRHPSYLPMELMACGALVVTNYNPHTGWLLRDQENCLLTETSATAVADTIIKGLSDHTLRNRVTTTAQETVRQYSNWDGEAEKIYRYMLAVS